MTPSGNSFGRVILFNAFGHHCYGNLIISFSVAISYFSMPFSQSNTLSRAELILIQIMKIEYYNKVSFSLIFLLNEKKKKKKKKKKLPRRDRFYFWLWLFEMMTRIFWTKTK